MIVADTNLVAYLFLESSGTRAARKVWDRDPEWILPRFWRTEYLNVLYLAVKTRGLDRGSALRAWRAGRELVGENEAEVSETGVLQTAIHYSITAYDAQFVVLAEDLGVPLVTADRGLVKACPDVAVTYGGFLGGRS